MPFIISYKKVCLAKINIFLNLEDSLFHSRKKKVVGHYYYFSILFLYPEFGNLAQAFWFLKQWGQEFMWLNGRLLV